MRLRDALSALFAHFRGCLPPPRLAEVLSGMSFMILCLMAETSSTAVETGSLHEGSVVSTGVAQRAERAWSRSGNRRWRYALLRRMLALADSVAALLASSSLVFVGPGEPEYLAWSLVFLPAWIVLAKILGLYDRDGRTLRHLTTDEGAQIVLWAVIGTSGLALFLEASPAGLPEASSGLVVGGIAALSAFLLRALARRSWRALTPPNRVAVVGSQAAAVLRRKLDLFPDLHMSIVDVRDQLGDASDVEWLARVDRLVFAPDRLEAAQVDQVVDICRSAEIVLSIVPPCRPAFESGVQLHHLAELPLLDYRMSGIPRSTLLLKRVLDVAVSAIALVVLLPLFVLIALAIKLDTRGSVMFSQRRAGLEGRPFHLRKFRSMVSDAEDLLDGLVSFEALDEPVFKLHNDPRVTRVGHVLRRWSLDELPQLWNVLVGDMSLVGPRPEQLELVERYAPEQRFRLSIKPGITGPMQVYGRGELTFVERLAVERDYIDNPSIGRDLRILGMTIPAVVRGRGAF